MRMKRTAICVLSAMLVLGAGTLTSYAATGWNQNGNNWVYYDTNGYQVTNEWKKGADNLWRYLDAQGVMAVNSWVDDEFYVDNNGIMLVDKWQKLQKKNSGWDTDNTTGWYYFGNSGKAVTDGWSKIAGKFYFFDADGTMQTGWADDNTYYLGDDGAMRTGWMYLQDPEEEDDFESSLPFENTEGKHWYYFQTSGKKYTPSLGNGDYKLYKVDGVYYCFDEQGRMQTGWVNMGDKESGSFENYRYFDKNGKVQTGWLSIEPPEDLEGDFEDDVQWYYFSTNGIPKVGVPVTEASTGDLVKINGITYLFDENGNPVFGLRRLAVGSGDDYATYYFGSNKATSSVVKGKGVIEEGDGTKWEYYFDESGSKTGRGHTGVKNGYLFYQGKLQKASDGTRYEPVNIGDRTYLVNASGKIAKSTTVKDAAGTKYKTNSNGEILQIDEANNNGHAEGREPYEPVYWED